MENHAVLAGLAAAWEAGKSRKQIKTALRAEMAGWPDKRLLPAALDQALLMCACGILLDEIISGRCDADLLRSLTDTAPQFFKRPRTEFARIAAFRGRHREAMALHEQLPRHLRKTCWDALPMPAATADALGVDLRMSVYAAVAEEKWWLVARMFSRHGDAGELLAAVDRSCRVKISNGPQCCTALRDAARARPHVWMTAAPTDLCWIRYHAQRRTLDIERSLQKAAESVRIHRKRHAEFEFLLALNDEYKVNACLTVLRNLHFQQRKPEERDSHRFAAKRLLEVLEKKHQEAGAKLREEPHMSFFVDEIYYDLFAECAPSLLVVCCRAHSRAAGGLAHIIPSSSLLIARTRPQPGGALWHLFTEAFPGNAFDLKRMYLPRVLVLVLAGRRRARAARGRPNAVPFRAPPPEILELMFRYFMPPIEEQT